MLLLSLVLAATPPEGFVTVEGDDPFGVCGRAGEHIVAPTRICERKASVETLHVRSKKHERDATWTVRLDFVTFSEKDAAEVRALLAELSASRQSGERLLSWCPRAYVWRSPTELLVAATACGGKKPLCEVTRAFAPSSATETPWAVFGYEGGNAVQVRDGFAGCERGR